MKTWIPFLFERMLESHIFVEQLVHILILEDSGALWKKVPKYYVGILLRSRNSVLLDSPSAKTGQEQKALVERVCSEALARAAMHKRFGLDLRQKN